MSPNLAVMFFEFVAFLFAISFHEAAHAWVANRCGDPTAKMLGRVTLNPISHIDFFGTILFPIIGIVLQRGFIGWAKPTPVDTRNLKNPVRDDILVTLAGPASNIVLIVIFGVIFKFYSRTVPMTKDTALLELLSACISINIILAIFNLLPIPPLDGSHVVRHFLSGSALEFYDRVGTYGLILFFVANLYFDFFGLLLRPAYRLVGHLLT